MEHGHAAAARRVAQPGQDLGGPERREVEDPRGTAILRQGGHREVGSVPAQGEASVTTGSARPAPPPTAQRLGAAGRGARGRGKKALLANGMPQHSRVDAVGIDDVEPAGVEDVEHGLRGRGSASSPGSGPTIRVRQLGK